MALRESARASQVFTATGPAMRIANWHQVTDANWLLNNPLGDADASGASQLKNMQTNC